MARHVDVDPVLREEFHRVVNMSSRELSEWLRTRSASEAARPGRYRDRSTGVADPAEAPSGPRRGGRTHHAQGGRADTCAA